MRLILWDVDGTLIRAGPVAAEVFDRAVERVVGRHPGDHGVVMGGKTDPQIAREILATMAVAGEAAHAHLPGVLTELERELAAAAALMSAHGRVLPGVPEVLQALHDDPAVEQTVLTGNLVANAAVKLAAFGLDHWLNVEVGAFGSDHHDRRQLVPVAVERVQRRYGRTPDTVWVVGDTTHDLACARAAGVHCLLVATGRVTLADLTAAGPDAVLSSLADVEVVLGVLRG